MMAFLSNTGGLAPRRYDAGAGRCSVFAQPVSSYSDQCEATCLSAAWIEDRVLTFLNGAHNEANQFSLLREDCPEPVRRPFLLKMQRFLENFECIGGKICDHSRGEFCVYCATWSDSRITRIFTGVYRRSRHNWYGVDLYANKFTLYNDNCYNGLMALIIQFMTQKEIIILNRSCRSNISIDYRQLLLQHNAFLPYPSMFTICDCSKSHTCDDHVHRCPTFYLQLASCAEYAVAQRSKIFNTFTKFDYFWQECTCDQCDEFRLLAANQYLNSFNFVTTNVHFLTKTFVINNFKKIDKFKDGYDVGHLSNIIYDKIKHYPLKKFLSRLCEVDGDEIYYRNLDAHCLHIKRYYERHFPDDELDVASDIINLFTIPAPVVQMIHVMDFPFVRDWLEGNFGNGFVPNVECPRVLISPTVSLSEFCSDENYIVEIEELERIAVEVKYEMDLSLPLYGGKRVKTRTCTREDVIKPFFFDCGELYEGKRWHCVLNACAFKFFSTPSAYSQYKEFSVEELRENGFHVLVDIPKETFQLQLLSCPVDDTCSHLGVCERTSTVFCKNPYIRLVGSNSGVFNISSITSYNNFISKFGLKVHVVLGDSVLLNSCCSFFTTMYDYFKFYNDNDFISNCLVVTSKFGGHFSAHKEDWTLADGRIDRGVHSAVYHNTYNHTKRIFSMLCRNKDYIFVELVPVSDTIISDVTIQDEQLSIVAVPVDIVTQISPIDVGLVKTTFSNTATCVNKDQVLTKTYVKSCSPGIKYEDVVVPRDNIVPDQSCQSYFYGDGFVVPMILFNQCTTKLSRCCRDYCFSRDVNQRANLRLQMIDDVKCRWSVVLDRDKQCYSDLYERNCDKDCEKFVDYCINKQRLELVEYDSVIFPSLAKQKVNVDTPLNGVKDYLKCKLLNIIGIKTRLNAAAYYTHLTDTSRFTELYWTRFLSFARINLTNRFQCFYFFDYILKRVPVPFTTTTIVSLLRVQKPRQLIHKLPWVFNRPQPISEFAHVPKCTCKSPQLTSICPEPIDEHIIRVPTCIVKVPQIASICPDPIDEDVNDRVLVQPKGAQLDSIRPQSLVEDDMDLGNDIALGQMDEVNCCLPNRGNKSSFDVVRRTSLYCVKCSSVYDFACGCNHVLNYPIEMRKMHKYDLSVKIGTQFEGDNKPWATRLLRLKNSFGYVKPLIGDRSSTTLLCAIRCRQAKPVIHEPFIDYHWRRVMLLVTQTGHIGHRYKINRNEWLKSQRDIYTTAQYKRYEKAVECLNRGQLYQNHDLNYWFKRSDSFLKFETIRNCSMFGTGTLAKAQRVIINPSPVTMPDIACEVSSITNVFKYKTHQLNESLQQMQFVFGWNNKRVGEWFVGKEQYTFLKNDFTALDQSWNRQAVDSFIMFLSINGVAAKLLDRVRLQFTSFVKTKRTKYQWCSPYSLKSGVNYTSLANTFLNRYLSVYVLSLCGVVEPVGLFHGDDSIIAFQGAMDLDMYEKTMRQLGFQVKPVICGFSEAAFLNCEPWYDEDGICMAPCLKTSLLKFGWQNRHVVGWEENVLYAARLTYSPIPYVSRWFANCLPPKKKINLHLSDVQCGKFVKDNSRSLDLFRTRYGAYEAYLKDVVLYRDNYIPYSFFVENDV